MFLTTNRVETFDPAFESRIHISMHFFDLTLSSRREVWKTFLKLDSESSPDITQEDVEEFTKVEMNGRQIKNVVKSASLLALSERGGLKAEHVRTVLRIKGAEKRL